MGATRNQRALLDRKYAIREMSAQAAKTNAETGQFNADTQRQRNPFEEMRATAAQTTANANADDVAQQGDLIGKKANAAMNRDWQQNLFDKQAATTDYNRGVANVESERNYASKQPAKRDMRSVKQYDNAGTVIGESFVDVNGPGYGAVQQGGDGSFSAGGRDFINKNAGDVRKSGDVMEQEAATEADKARYDQEASNLAKHGNVNPPEQAQPQPEGDALSRAFGGSFDPGNIINAGVSGVKGAANLAPDIFNAPKNVGKKIYDKTADYLKWQYSAN